MRNTLIITSTVAALFIFGTYSFAADKSLTGIVTDDMCARKHTMMPGKPDSDCVRACVKAGRERALLVANKLYKLEGQSAEVDSLAAKRARVTGDLTGDVVHVVTVETAK
jgi:hypothetical protein